MFLFFVLLGLVSRVVPEKDLDSELAKITDAIKHKSRSVIALGKEFFYKQLNLPIEEAYRLGAVVSTNGYLIILCHVCCYC